jgi:hypothetical protein
MIVPKRAHLFCLLFCLLATACSSERGEEALENYHARLGNVFDGIDVSAGPDVVTEDRAETFSSLGLPKQAIKASSDNGDIARIDLMDFLSLYGCRLQEVVARANASLGKLAPSSQRLISDLRFIELAPECIDLLGEKDEPELAQQLGNVLDLKRTELEARMARSIFEGPEYREFWKMPLALNDYPSADLSGESERALMQLVGLRDAWLNGRVSEGRSDFESLLFQISTGDGGALLKAYQLLLSKLYDLNALLNHVLGARNLCEPVRPYSREILQNVVQKFFVGDVQVWAAALNKRQYALQAAMEALEPAFESVLSAEYLSWSKQRDALFFETRHAIQMHVQKIQILLNEDSLSAWCAQRKS